MKDWTFDGFEREFDAHVRQHLPWYDVAADAVALIAKHYIPHRGLIYDIGCSTGNVGRSLGDTIESREVRLIGIDNCEDMAKTYQAPGELVIADASSYEFERFDVAVMFLTLMFMPVAERSDFVRRLRSRLKPGGAIVIFDRCVAATGYEATVMMRMIWNGKLQAGVSFAEVAEKEMRLAGIQRPIEPHELGGEALEIFRFADFAGWIIRG
ncbi:methyltransferase domain-containing protein [Agrobacterium vitis]|uniref:Methyltransferase domain-containing protein n=1 Tax=Agrobacterium vitis TaxID=373 RepID=A0ABD6GB50_AGRVI|nr:methyltransferase domain-containing protein [Agrobacterium vitis]MCF1454102.1 methyltransferase domain-containing protein [Agrobacterium vitis]MUO78129.1 methyltransferase domain-containing protein [Agrobacterium vitis]MUO94007.1 methyltransferase domain-containing protein [Agrobacterium vitis]MUP03539.1 methyltransferase domain-containing protein [Agrobacterium vitis]MUZ85086.1 methyltransferase domain-containing protein [Agrobacterium vitis]